MLKHIIHTWVFILWDHSLLTWTKSGFCCQNTENQNLKMQKSSPWASFQPQSCSTWLHNVFINLDKHLYVGKSYITSESLSFLKNTSWVECHCAWGLNWLELSSWWHPETQYVTHSSHSSPLRRSLFGYPPWTAIFLFHFRPPRS